MTAILPEVLTGVRVVGHRFDADPTDSTAPRMAT